MPSVSNPPDTPRPAGYLLLQQRHALASLPHHVESFITHGTRRTHSTPEKTQETYPRAYWPGESDFEHLEFALKREGLHLQLLRALLPRMSAREVAAYVRSKPTSAYARRIWYLFEEFTGRCLNLEDVNQGNYVDLLNSQDYYTGPAVRSPRHRVNVNLLGSLAFSPLVRRTKKLKAAEGKRLEELCRTVISGIPPELHARALQHLYTKETKSSYAIERETPDQRRAQKFADALREASLRDYLLKETLVALQQAIVDPRFANQGWRDSIGEQNFVSRSVGMNEEEMHFIAPRPQDLAELMDAYLNTSRRILHSNLHPVIAAAVIAYPFVFLHPFSDGNGRLHRFLIHYVLSFRRFAPDGVVFPISATLLHRPQDYDASLESFSRPLLPLIDYQLDSRGRMTVANDTRDFYRYVDCTSLTEILFGFVEETIEKELPSEIRFLQQYDTARKLMRQVVDLPNRHADLLVRLCLQNNGALSKAKRQLPEYAGLSHDEIAGLEAAIAEAFGLPTRK
ncbi:MAG: Fic family protein [Verrucomicrobiota bacterium]